MTDDREPREIESLEALVLSLEAERDTLKAELALALGENAALKVRLAEVAAPSLARAPLTKEQNLQGRIHDVEDRVSNLERTLVNIVEGEYPCQA